MERYILAFIFSALFLQLRCQHAYYPVGHSAIDLSQRYAICGTSGLNADKLSPLALRMLKRGQKKYYYYSSMSRGCRPYRKSEADIFNMEYLAADNPAYDDTGSLSRQPVLKYLYKYRSSFYFTAQADYYLSVNPVLGLSAGYDAKDPKRKIFQNTRGAELYGNIGGDKGVGFYTYFTDNQLRFPQYMGYYTDSIGVTPNELYWKNFKQSASDFFQAKAYITFTAAKYIHFQFGHDKHFVGNGYRSLILSDFAPQYLFLKINTEIGRFNYQNLFTQFTDYSPLLGNTLFRKKYAAFHRLGINILPNLNIGLNEMVIFDRQDDSTGKSKGYDLNYANPVIFYRAMETNLGSRDNAMLAIDWKWNFLGRYSFYGQAVLDEFVLKQLKQQPDWWGNKYGYQLGIKYINMLGIRNFDGQAEYNRVRPFTYSHYRSSQSYSHFNQALAHPLGANFSEWIGILKYQPLTRLTITLTQIIAKRGADSSLNGSNYGSNILRDNDTRATSNISTLQGNLQTLNITDLTLTWMPKHNLFIDAKMMIRNLTNSTPAPKTILFSLGLRFNIMQRKLDY